MRQRVCTAEYLATKCCQELAPLVTRLPPKEDINYGMYGLYQNEVCLSAKWANPGAALRRIYTMSSQPGAMNELWRHAWPKSLWSDLLADGLSETWPVLEVDHNGYEHQLHIRLRIDVASDEPLQLPWNWLAQYLLHTPAAALEHYLHAIDPQLSTWLFAEITLYRPAQAGRTQEVMFKSFSGFVELHDDDASDTCSVLSDCEQDSDPVTEGCNNRQVV